jgi:hypothetical protein
MEIIIFILKEINEGSLNFLRDFKILLIKEDQKYFI